MANMEGPFLALTIFALGMCFNGVRSAEYLGKFLGKLSELHHGVSGEVYAVDARTLHIKDFTYDGQGPAAYFFAGSSRAPASSGFRIRDETGSPDVLRRYRREGVTITLPEGKSLSSIRWFSVWCEEFEVNFGDVKIPKNLDYPRPQKIDGLRGVHGIASDNIVIVDAQTLLIPSLSYDGEAPDAKFWVGRGPKPSPQGVRVPDENGKELPLRRYDRKTVVLTLPADLTVFDIGHFGIWCEAFTVDFGHVPIPHEPNVPPSLKMLGVSPQSKLNCEVLHDDLAFEVRWAVAGDSIVLQLVAKLESREYMSFGISGDSDRSQMIGGDVVVAWVDKDTLKGYAEDYYLEAKAQCSGPRGSCPDVRLADDTNNIRLLNAAMVNGYSIVTYQRPLRPADGYDKPVLTNQSQAVIWALGPLNQRDEVSFHTFYPKQDKFIDFGRPAKWNCPMPEGDQQPMRATTQEPEPAAPQPSSPPPPARSRGRNASRGTGRQQEDSEKSASRQRSNERRTLGRSSPRPAATPAPVAFRNAWAIPPIQCDEPDDGVFYAQMGPTGGKHGYPAITGHVGWGISWYINGLLIPEINLVRGKTYTFVVEGGFDPDVPAKYHPFYITDDPVGGYAHKTAEERRNVKIFAGARQAKDGSVQPTGVGRLCHWTPQGDADADDFDSFGAYQRTLELKCDIGEPGVIQWTPDQDTPDTVYYQCFTHRYLGWKVNVLDACDMAAAASEVAESVADLAGSASSHVPLRAHPNNIEEVIAKEERYAQDLPHLDSKYAFRPDNHSATLVQLPIPPKDPAPHRHFPANRRPGPPTLLRPHLAHMPMMVKLRRPTMYVKKPYYRPLLKMPLGRPMMKYAKPILVPMRPAAAHRLPLHALPSNIIIMKAPFSSHLLHRAPDALQLASEPNVALSDPPQLQAAVNLGFDPSSVVIEGGFQPIVSKDIDSRADDADVAIEGDPGVIDARAEEGARASGHFEPMFIPSPVVDVRKRAKAHHAARRSSAAYLPPDVVTTFDGRKVSGASLTLRADTPDDPRAAFHARSAHTVALLRQPQAVPFQGQLPPPLEAKGRRRREAHHNEEHTAQQQRERAAASAATPHVQIGLAALFASLALRLAA